MPSQPNTPNFGFKKPRPGLRGWEGDQDSNWELLDQTLKSSQNASWISSGKLEAALLPLGAGLAIEDGHIVAQAFLGPIATLSAAGDLSLAEDSPVDYAIMSDRSVGRVVLNAFCSGPCIIDFALDIQNIETGDTTPALVTTFSFGGDGVKVRRAEALVEAPIAITAESAVILRLISVSGDVRDVRVDLFA